MVGGVAKVSVYLPDELKRAAVAADLNFSGLLTKAITVELRLREEPRPPGRRPAELVELDETPAGG